MEEVGQQLQELVELVELVVVAMVKENPLMEMEIVGKQAPAVVEEV